MGILLLSLIAGGDDFAALVPGMAVLGIGVGLFYSSVTTAAVTALDKSYERAWPAAIIYMCEIAGGSVGLGLNTAIVTASASLVDGIRDAFLLDAVLAFCALRRLDAVRRWLASEARGPVARLVRWTSAPSRSG